MNSLAKTIIIPLHITSTFNEEWFSVQTNANFHVWACSFSIIWYFFLPQACLEFVRYKRSGARNNNMLEEIRWEQAIEPLRAMYFVRDVLNGIIKKEENRLIFSFW